MPSLYQIRNVSTFAELQKEVKDVVPYATFEEGY